MSMADIEKNIAAFGKKARDGKLSMAEMSGGVHHFQWRHLRLHAFNSNLDPSSISDPWDAQYH